MNAAPSADGERVLLRDGAELVIRPVRPEDKDVIAAGFERLSPESRFRRFFTPLRRLGESDLRYLTEIDHHDHEALLALDAATGDGIGVARYVRGAEPAVAEVAIAVVDDWHHRGVATALLVRLVERARAAGIDRFLALVLSENRDALKLFERLAPAEVERRRSSEGHIELLLALPAPDELHESGLMRALKAAARGALHANPWRVMREAIARQRPGRRSSGAGMKARDGNA